MSCSIEDKIKNIANKEYKYFLNKENVIGVGLGYKIIKGFNTYQKCIKVFVSKKVPNYMLKESDKVPIIYNGFKTDVIKIGKVEIQGFTDRVRPVTGGYNIGPAFFNEYSGTYSCMVSDDKDYFMLGCNHIMAAVNEATINTPILQPSPFFGGKLPDDIVGNLSKFIPIKFKTEEELPENLVDCAMAKITDISLVSELITSFGAIKGIKEPVLDLFVKKVGAITGVTLGHIDAIGTTLEIDYTDTKKALFKNLIITSPMSDQGDSGALIFDIATNAVGLIIAGSDERSIATPILEVLSALDVKIVI